MRQVLAVPGAAEDAHEEAWPVLLHLDVLDGDVECTSVEEALHQVVEMFGHQIVEVGLFDMRIVRVMYYLRPVIVKRFNL